MRVDSVKQAKSAESGPWTLCTAPMMDWTESATLPTFRAAWDTFMATFEKRGTRWRAKVRRAREAPLTKTFPTKGQAQVWAERTEREIWDRRATGDAKADSKTLKALIEWYEVEQAKLTPWGRSKKSDLARLKTYSIAERIASTLRSKDYVKHAEERRKGGAGPATVLNDLIWIKGVLKAAEGSEGLTKSSVEVQTAIEHLKQRRIVAKSRERERRLAPGEKERILEHFRNRDARSQIPMVDIVEFALLTGRRQEEIVRLKWCDVKPVEGIAWLDDVKHPTQKTGNRRAFRLLKAALDIVERQPKGDLVFPYNSKSVGAAFTRAIQFLGIEDLHFHDLRHEAISLLFEKGYSIQEVALFSLHDSWQTLKRYTQLRPENVKER